MHAQIVQAVLSFASGELVQIAKDIESVLRLNALDERSDRTSEAWPHDRTNAVIERAKR